MDKIDYWFLDTAIEELIGFSWIVPDEKYGDLTINRAPLPLSMNEIVEVLHRLFQEENLFAIKADDLFEVYEINNLAECHNLLVNKGFIPNRKQIELALKEEEPLTYFLTKKGGELWESVSYPQWDKYIILRSGSGYQTLSCSNYNLAKKLLEIQHLLDQGGYYYSPVIETIKWETFTPWYPTYWKTLPTGYKVFYEVTHIDIDPDVDTIENDSNELIEDRQKAEELFYNVCNCWYTNYFRE